MAVDFANIDQSGAEGAIEFLDRVAQLDGTRDYRWRCMQLLELSPGCRVLDVGCGTGDDCIAMAEAAGCDEVVGVDVSKAMIAEAQRRARDHCLPVRFQQADIAALPFEDGTFDAVHIDRVLHFLKDPFAAMSEVARVTRAGGRVVVSEPDWNTLSVEGGAPELDRKAQRFIASRQGADTGSQLSSYFRSAGLEVREQHGVLVETSDLDLSAMLFDIEGLAGRALEAGALTGQEVLEWLRALQDGSGRGSFRASLAGYTVAGHR